MKLTIEIIKDAIFTIALCVIIAAGTIFCIKKNTILTQQEIYQNWVYPVGRKATQEELAAAILNIEQQLNTEQPTRNQTTNMKLYTRFHFDLSDTKKG